MSLPRPCMRMRNTTVIWTCTHLASLPPSCMRMRNTTVLGTCMHLASLPPSCMRMRNLERSNCRAYQHDSYSLYPPAPSRFPPLACGCGTAQDTIHHEWFLSENWTARPRTGRPISPLQPRACGCGTTSLIHTTRTSPASSVPPPARLLPSHAGAKRSTKQERAGRKPEIPPPPAPSSATRCNVQRTHQPPPRAQTRTAKPPPATTSPAPVATRYPRAPWTQDHPPLPDAPPPEHQERTAAARQNMRPRTHSAGGTARSELPGAATPTSRLEMPRKAPAAPERPPEPAKETHGRSLPAAGRKWPLPATATRRHRPHGYLNRQSTGAEALIPAADLRRTHPWQHAVAARHFTEKPPGSLVLCARLCIAFDFASAVSMPCHC